MESSKSQVETLIRLGSEELAKLTMFIRRSLRVTKTDRPVFEDVGGLIDQTLLDTDHVVYGRRGSGKSALLLSAYWAKKDRQELALYLDAQEYRGQSYADIVMSMVIEVLRYLDEAIGEQYSFLRGLLARLRGKNAAKIRAHLQQKISELETELFRPEEYPLEEERVVGEREVEAIRGHVGTTGIPQVPVGIQVGRERDLQLTTSERRSLMQRKTDYIERNRPALGRVIDEALSLFADGCMFLEVDDFYFIERERQPYVIDYLFRLTKHRPIYLKVATIKYRSLLFRSTEAETVGVLSHGDVQPIDLDRTLEDKSALAATLYRILEALAEKAGVPNARFQTLLTEGAKDLLVDASGGVPRDFLVIFVLAQDIASERHDRKITKWAVGEAARRHLEQSKREMLALDARADRAELEEVLGAIEKWALEQRQTTVFLVDKAECEEDPDAHHAIKALLDLRFLHLVAADTSASYGGGHRYEACLLDPGIWASPRRWHLNEVRYDRRDERGRRDELRNAPTLPLSVVREALDRASDTHDEGT